MYKEENEIFEDCRGYRTVSRIIKNYEYGLLCEEDEYDIPINEEEHGQSSSRSRFEKISTPFGSIDTCRRIEEANKRKEELNFLTVVGDAIEKATIGALLSL